MSSADSRRQVSLQSLSQTEVHLTEKRSELNQIQEKVSMQNCDLLWLAIKVLVDCIPLMNINFGKSPK